MVRIEGFTIPELENAVTRAVYIGDSTEDVNALLGGNGDSPESKSDAARALLLDTLREAGGQMESDQLDAAVAEAAGVAAKTVRNLRAGLKNQGWSRAIPEKDDTGAVQRWLVALTNAAPGPAEEPLSRGAVSPEPVARANTTKSGSGLFKPNQEPEPECPGYARESGPGPRATRLQTPDRRARPLRPPPGRAEAVVSRVQGGGGVSARPSPAERLADPDAVLTRTDLRELGWERRAVDAIVRGCPAVAIPGYARTVVLVRDYQAFLAEHTFRGDRVRPCG